MLDYKELSINPYHLNRNGDSVNQLLNEVVGDELIGGALRGDWRMGDLAQWVGSWGTGAVSSEDTAKVKEREGDIVRELGGLKRDAAGNPILSKYKDQAESAGRTRMRAISGLHQTADTEADKALARLYKMGVKEHGAVSSKLRDASQVTKQKIEGFSDKYDLETGRIEDEAIEELSRIEDIIVGAPGLYEKGQSDSHLREVGKGLYKTGGEYEKKGKYQDFDVATLGGPVNPERVIQEAFEYDYRTGKKKPTR